MALEVPTAEAKTAQPDVLEMVERDITNMVASAKEFQRQVEAGELATQDFSTDKLMEATGYLIQEQGGRDSEYDYDIPQIISVTYRMEQDNLLNVRSALSKKGSPEGTTIEELEALKHYAQGKIFLLNDEMNQIFELPEDTKDNKEYRDRRFRTNIKLFGALARERDYAEQQLTLRREASKQ